MSLNFNSYLHQLSYIFGTPTEGNLVKTIPSPAKSWSSEWGASPPRALVSVSWGRSGHAAWNKPLGMDGFQPETRITYVCAYLSTHTHTHIYIYIYILLILYLSHYWVIWSRTQSVGLWVLRRILAKLHICLRSSYVRFTFWLPYDEYVVHIAWQQHRSKKLAPLRFCVWRCAPATTPK